MSALKPPLTPSAPLDKLRVLLMGFGEFERHALASYLRLTGMRVPAYEQVESIDVADFVIADADHPGAIDAVMAADRGADTVYIGSLAPEGALAWAMRPIDPLQVFRELDAAVALRHFKAAPALHAPSGPLPFNDETTPQRRASDVVAMPLALVVDDSEIAQRFLQRHLQALGVRTEVASDSAQALQRMAQQRFDVVFLDLDLGPDSPMNGFVLCQHLKQEQRPHGTGLPPLVIIVSAHASATDRVRGTFAGCDAYLTKPIDEPALQRHLLKVGLLVAPEPVRVKRKVAAAAAPADSIDATKSAAEPT